MSCEPLGIFDELQARRKTFARFLPPDQRPAREDPPPLPPPPPPPTVEQIVARTLSGKALARAVDIIQGACTVFSVDAADVMSAGTLRRGSQTRQAAMSLMAKLLKLSEPTIGAVFSRDHSTVNHAKLKVRQLRGKDKGFRQRHDYLAQLLREKWAVARHG